MPLSNILCRVIIIIIGLLSGHLLMVCLALVVPNAVIDVVVVVVIEVVLALWGGAIRFVS